MFVGAGSDDRILAYEYTCTGYEVKPQTPSAGGFVMVRMRIASTACRLTQLFRCLSQLSKGSGGPEFSISSKECAILSTGTLTSAVLKQE